MTRKNITPVVEFDSGVVLDRGFFEPSWKVVGIAAGPDRGETLWVACVCTHCETAAEFRPIDLWQGRAKACRCHVERVAIGRNTVVSALPAGLLPRGLSRVQAAEYVSISPSKFDQMVADGRMPKPKRVDARVFWDRLEIDAAFTALGADGASQANGSAVATAASASNQWDNL